MLLVLHGRLCESLCCSQTTDGSLGCDCDVLRCAMQIHVCAVGDFTSYVLGMILLVHKVSS